MSYSETFSIKSIRLLSPSTCEIYMLNHTKKCMKAWLISCTNGKLQEFNDKMNHLLLTSQPFDQLMKLKNLYKIEVLK